MIVFVGGIHGVGKTYLGAPTAKHLGIRHATASQLIREERGLQSWGADKRVKGIDENQAALISATNRLRSGGQKLLLDGHFVLRGATGELNEIAPQVFRDLKIGAVLLLHASVDVVFERLQARGDTSWTESELHMLTEREEAHARRVSADLDVTFRYLTAPSQNEFGDAISAILDA
jgi:adenylate kinase